jgi:hypothetical protein
MEAGPGPEHRYPALRTIAGIFRIPAWLIVIGGALVVVIATIVVADSSGAGEAILTAVGGGITVAIYAVLNFALAELIGLAIAIEENTRRGAGR